MRAIIALAILGAALAAEVSESEKRFVMTQLVNQPVVEQVPVRTMRPVAYHGVRNEPYSYMRQVAVPTSRRVAYTVNQPVAVRTQHQVQVPVARKFLYNVDRPVSVPTTKHVPYAKAVQIPYQTAVKVPYQYTVQQAVQTYKQVPVTRTVAVPIQKQVDIPIRTHVRVAAPAVAAAPIATGFAAPAIAATGISTGVSAPAMSFVHSAPISTIGSGYYSGMGTAGLISGTGFNTAGLMGTNFGSSMINAAPAASFSTDMSMGGLSGIYGAYGSGLISPSAMASGIVADAGVDAGVVEDLAEE